MPVAGWRLFGKGERCWTNNPELNLWLPTMFFALSLGDRHLLHGLIEPELSIIASQG